MKQAGAVLLGTQTMDEYAYGFTTENAHDGTTRNPHDASRVAGGSSGGSAASVAANLGVVALASDTNGSIRVPASFCGVFGLKPTYGRLPRTGAFPFVFDLDHVGPLARNTEDLALVYDALQGPDPRDPACAAHAVEPALPHLAQFPERLRIGVLDGWFHDNADSGARAAVGHVADALGVRERVSLKGAEAARASAFLITAAQGANLHLENLRRRAGAFDPATRDRLLAGALLPAAFVVQAQRVRRWFSDEVAEVFRYAFDILLAPSTPCAATLIGQETLELNGNSYPARASIGLLTQPLSCIGLPIVSVPVCRAGALPIGVQIIAPPWHEKLALQVSAHLERIGAVGAAPVP
jgi:AtzE family amidohydrolase